MHTADETRRGAATWVTHTHTHTSTPTHTAHTHTHLCAHPFAYWLNNALCQETETETETGTGTEKKKKKNKPSEPQRIAPNRSEPYSEPHALYFHNLFWDFLKFSKRQRERGAEGEVEGGGGVATVSCSSRQQAPGSSQLRQFRPRLSTYKLCRKYFFCAAARPEKANRRADSGQCHSECATHPSLPPPPIPSFPAPTLIASHEDCKMLQQLVASFLLLDK